MKKLIHSERSIVLAIDFQEKLMPAIDQANSVVQRAQALLQAAHYLDIPTLGTVQDSQKIGNTVAPLAAFLPHIIEKKTFGAVADAAFMQALQAIKNKTGRDEIILIGCEAHVCVLQTALGLLERNWQVKLVADACGSRLASNKEWALQRAATHGAEIVCAEMVLFEWLQSSSHPRFKDVLKLIKPLN